MAENSDSFDDFFQYHWGWKWEWYGWRRMLWFCISVDLKYWVVYVILFGLALSYGRHVVEMNYSTTTSLPKGDRFDG